MQLIFQEGEGLRHLDQHQVKAAFYSVEAAKHPAFIRSEAVVPNVQQGALPRQIGVRNHGRFIAGQRHRKGSEAVIQNQHVRGVCQQSLLVYVVQEVLVTCVPGAQQILLPPGIPAQLKRAHRYSKRLHIILLPIVGYFGLPPARGATGS